MTVAQKEKTIKSQIGKRILCFILIAVVVATLFFPWASLSSSYRAESGFFSELISSLLPSELTGGGIDSHLEGVLKSGGISPLNAHYILVKYIPLLSQMHLLEDETTNLLNTASIILTVILTAVVLTVIHTVVCYILKKRYTGYGTIISTALMAGCFVLAVIYGNQEAGLTPGLFTLTPWPFIGLAVSVAAVIIAGSIRTPKQTKAVAQLHAISGMYAGADFNIAEGEEIVLGRDPSLCNIIFDQSNASISRRHCTIRFSPAENCYFVTDWSKNGTFTRDGVRLQPQVAAPISRGTEIYLGNEEEAFRLE